MNSIYHLMKAGYVDDHLREFDPVLIIKSESKEYCLLYCMLNNLDLSDHYVDSISFEYINGVRVPVTLNDQPEWVVNIEYNNDFDCELGELAQHYDEVLKTIPLGSTGKSAKGFTIGKGKQLHWYINPCPNTGKYKCYPQYGNGEIGSPSYHYPEKKITIRY